MKTKRIILIAVAVAAVVDEGIWLFTGSPAKHKVMYASATVGKGGISNSVTATGAIGPVIEAEVGMQVSGIIDKVYANYSSVVAERRLIAEMDCATLQSELTSRQAIYDGAKAEFRCQRRNYECSKELHDKSSISDAGYEQALYNYRKTKNAFDSSKASLTKAERNLPYAAVTSSIDGVVISRSVEAGQTVTSGFETPTLFAIAASLTQTQVVADVDEADIGGVEEGQHASFTVDVYPDDVLDRVMIQIHSGDTSSNSSAGSNTSTVITYEVVISVPNLDLKLKPRLITNATILIFDKKDVLSVPSRALRLTPEAPSIDKSDIVKDREGEHRVWTRGGTTFMAHPVRIGVGNGIPTEIISGVAERTKTVMETTIDAMSDENMDKGLGQRNEERSLFIPSPPGNNKKKSNKQLNMKKVIGLQDIGRDFQVGEETVHALWGVSFTINRGEFVTIMGASGSGKSILLNTLGCLDTPTSGEYLLDNIPVRIVSKPQRIVLRNRKIDLVFQSYNLLPKTTTVENVELPLMCNPSVSASERRRRAIEALQAVSLSGRLEHESNQISGGQMQHVAIVRAPVNNPAVILASEATGDLDTRTSLDILVPPQKLHVEGRTIILVTHNPEITQYNSQNIRLCDGHVTEDTVNSHVLSAAEALAALPKSDED